MARIETELLSPEVLDQVWWKYLANVMPTKIAYVQVMLQDRINFKISYSSEHRSVKITQEFEQWLFDQGAEVRQIKGKRYLQFVDASSATLFAMRWL